MKAFAIWLAGVAVLFGAFSYGYHQVRTGDPERVLVVVDSSFDMSPEWIRIDATLDGLDNEKYSEYALGTEKGLIHSWADSLLLDDQTPYAPRDFEALITGAAYADIGEPSEKILVTNAPDAELEGLEDWTIVRPG